jgi:hypothetical protein
VKKLPVAAIALFLVFAVVFADEEEKPFLQLAEGNFWKYDVLEGEDKESGKVEVEEFCGSGKYKLELTDMGKGSPDDTTWRIEKDCIIWEFAPGFDWKILKFGAKKGDAWTAGSGTIIKMWWAGGVGIVKLEVVDGGKTQTVWKLSSFEVGCSISDKKLKELVKEADVVAEITVPKESVGAKKASVKLAGTFKGKVKTKDGRIKITQSQDNTEVEPFKQGDFVVFLKKEGEALVLLHSALEAQEQLLDRLAKIFTPPGKSIEKFKEFAEKAEIIAGVEIVILEDRGSFKYYVAKIITTAKGAARRKYLDVLSVPGVKLDKGGKYILFLVGTEESGRKLTKPLDPVKGILEFDEGLISKLAEIAKDSE